MSSNLKVAPHTVVCMQYSLTTADGLTIRDASEKAICYLHGSGNLFPRLEAALAGHAVGDIVRVRLLPDDAFGRRDPELVQDIPLADFPPGEDIVVGGEVIGTRDDGEQTRFRVVRIEGETARLDGNHPLAGQTLVFEVEIQSVEPASEEEIRAGRPLRG